MSLGAPFSAQALSAAEGDDTEMKWIAPLLCLGFCASTQFSPCAAAQGGPPFRSDDPDTPGNRNWEINVVLMGNRNPSEGSYATPNIDINYGLGNRIQLKYELPLNIQESRGPSGHVAAGLGNSLFGLKWRLYSHHPRTEGPDRARKKESNFAVSIYPQLVLSNPTPSVRREIVEPGPQFLVPAEANARIGPLRISGEVGYWFTNQDVPSSWIRGLIVGHEFGNKTELALEFYDEAATRGVDDKDATRQSTLGIGCRTPLARDRSVWFIGMVGRSLVPVTRTNGQPSWIASLGLQFLTGRRRRHSNDE